MYTHRCMYLFIYRYIKEAALQLGLFGTMKAKEIVFFYLFFCSNKKKKRTLTRTGRRPPTLRLFSTKKKKLFSFFFSSFLFDRRNRRSKCRERQEQSGETKNPKTNAEHSWPPRILDGFCFGWKFRIRRHLSIVKRRWNGANQCLTRHRSDPLKKKKRNVPKITQSKKKRAEVVPKNLCHEIVSKSITMLTKSGPHYLNNTLR